ncbi:MAG: hypothetical protein KatS3mg063_2685 [Tepidiforma sp.]|uniref:hypothetical protein n=1 Tax=Tepidiforma sp. TaxID=2682230 RepID=UPI0021DE23C2|nr:hypothetical protein [Tepidiforma sp.]GIW16832.1 MAG: hypothetical protein KatS3mg063_2685 [Tepidiforma sp.]
MSTTTIAHPASAVKAALAGDGDLGDLPGPARALLEQLRAEAPLLGATAAAIVRRQVQAGGAAVVVTLRDLQHDLRARRAAIVAALAALQARGILCARAWRTGRRGRPPRAWSCPLLSATAVPPAVVDRAVAPAAPQVTAVVDRAVVPAAPQVTDLQARWSRAQAAIQPALAALDQFPVAFLSLIRPVDEDGAVLVIATENCLVRDAFLGHDEVDAIILRAWQAAGGRATQIAYVIAPEYGRVGNPPLHAAPAARAAAATEVAPPATEVAPPAPPAPPAGADAGAGLLPLLERLLGREAGETDRQQLTSLVAAAERARPGAGAYWVAQALRAALETTRPVRHPHAYLRQVLARWEREGSWGSPAASPRRGGVGTRPYRAARPAPVMGRREVAPCLA